MMSARFFFVLLTFCLILFSWSCQSDSSAKAPISPKENHSPKKEKESSSAVNQLSDVEKAAGWELLFDGKNLDKWRGYNLPELPQKGWSVYNEELVVQGGGGDIITKEQFENFELKLDFKVTESANSGIFYFVQELPDEPIYHSAPEYQLIDNQKYIEVQGLETMQKHLTGDNYDLHSGRIGLMKNRGQWNTARIIVNNKRVQHWLNGKKQVEYIWGSDEWKELIASSKFKDWAYAKVPKGHIGLQDHGNKVFFRNIKIKRL